MIREAVEYQPAETDQWTMDGLSLLTAMIGSEVFGTATRGQADAFSARSVGASRRCFRSPIFRTGMR